MNKPLVRKIQIILLFVILALISVTKVAPYTTNPETHAAITNQIDEEIAAVLKLTAGAAGASAVISLLPDDQCTPIANELAELAKYFLVVLSALYLEKYLVVVIGYVSFSAILPIALILLGVGIVLKRSTLKALSVKLSILALAVYLMVPVSVMASRLIYENYEQTIEDTATEADRIIINEDTEDTGIVDRFVNWISNAAVTVTEYVTNLLSRFVNALAVMLVASCLIPTLVILIFVWLIKLLFDIKVLPMFMLPGKGVEQQ